MRRWVAIGVVILLAASGAWFAWHLWDLNAPVEGNRVKNARLTVEEARQALIDLLVRDDAPNFDTRSREVTALRDGRNLTTVELPPGHTLSERWNCDLSAKTFSFATIKGSCMFQCHGVFERSETGWKAKVTSTSWGMLGP